MDRTDRVMEVHCFCCLIILVTYEPHRILLEVDRHPHVPLNIRTDYSDQALESEVRKVHRNEKARDRMFGPQDEDPGDVKNANHILHERSLDM